MSVIKTQEAIQTAWNIFKKEWTLFLPLFLLLMVLSYPYSELLSKNGMGAFAFLINVALQIASAVLGMVMIRAAIKLIDGERAEWSTLFDGLTANQVCIYIFTQFVTAVIVGVGFLLLVIPGAIFAMMLSQAQYLVASGEATGVGEALKKSREITRGNRLDLFFAGIVIGVLALLVSLTVIGAFIAIPVASLAMAVLYRQLKPKDGELIVA